MNGIFQGSQPAVAGECEFLANFSIRKKDFQNFVEIYRKEIFTFLTLISGDRKLAWQAARNIFEKAYYRISRISSAFVFRCWLFRLMISYARKWENESASEREDLSAEDREYEALEGVESQSQFEEIDLRKNPEELHRDDCLFYVLDQIDFDLRIILVMKDVLNLDTKFIAMVLDIPEGTTRSRLAKGRAAFSKHSGVVRLEKREM